MSTIKNLKIARAFNGVSVYTEYKAVDEDGVSYMGREEKMVQFDDVFERDEVLYDLITNGKFSDPNILCCRLHQGNLPGEYKLIVKNNDIKYEVTWLRLRILFNDRLTQELVEVQFSQEAPFNNLF